MIRTLNRTSSSLEQLLDTANAENVDLILTSSPMLLQHLQEHQKLAPFDNACRKASVWCRTRFGRRPWPWRSRVWSAD
jgi:ABC-type Fe3+ transport system substrate-binding protein